MAGQHADFGPAASQFLSECAAASPVRFGLLWASAGAFTATTAWLSALHETSLRAQRAAAGDRDGRAPLTALAMCLAGERPISMRRQYYLRISSMARVFAVTSALSLLAPRAWLLWHLCQRMMEAWALSTFGFLLFLLLWEHAERVPASHEESWTGRVFDNGMNVMSVLAAHGPGKHFAVPPLCCILAPCLRPGYLSSRQLLWIVSALNQFVIITPIIVIVYLWAVLVEALADLPWLPLALKFTQKASTLTALYGLFVLYSATHNALRAWNTTRKFIAIKAFLIVALVQEPAVELLVELAEGDGADDSTCIHGHNWAHFVCMWLLCLESVPMAVLLAKAFPAEELKPSHCMERSGDVIELELLNFMAAEGEDGVFHEASPHFHTRAACPPVRP